MVKTKQTPTGTEVVFDSDGNAFRLSRSGLARRLGRRAAGRNPVDYAIRQLGFVRVVMTVDYAIRQVGLVRGEMPEATVVVDFQPASANHLAVIAAFYEIAGHRVAGRAPIKFVLICRGEPDRFEVFSRLGPALRRIEELIKRDC